VRAPAGFKLYDALAACSDVLVRFGGHQAAAGFEAHVDRLPELRERFDAACRLTALRPSATSGTAPAVLPLFDADEPLTVLRDLYRLEPCGEGNPKPRLGVRAEVGSARPVKGGHLKLELALANGHTLSAFAPGLADAPYAAGDTVLAVGTLRPDHFRGGDAVELHVERLEAVVLRPRAEVVLATGSDG
jgi:single-stranded-DNA-specific exonuclease